ncbi:hypothetical protein HDU67_004755 [Dinochytrium kinnereticum]|nr:hypothetical protein HDU67_004755 [Dinochytrium kinnereticum]
MSITGVRGFNYNVSNMDESLHFYRDILGLSLESAADSMVVVKAGHTRISLNEKNAPIHRIPFDESGHHAGGTLSLQVVGMHHLVKKLKENGVRFLTDVEQTPWGDMAAFEDPDGNILRLYEVKV